MKLWNNLSFQGMSICAPSILSFSTKYIIAVSFVQEAAMIAVTQDSQVFNPLTNAQSKLS